MKNLIDLEIVASLFNQVKLLNKVKNFILVQVITRMKNSKAR